MYPHKTTTGKDASRHGVRRLLGIGLLLAATALGMPSAASAQYTTPAPVNGSAPVPGVPGPIATVLPPNGHLDGCDPHAAPPQNPFSATVSLNQDSFFGFYPMLAANYAITDVLDFTFYSILWTTPDFSPFGGGQGLWTEVGAGFNLNLMDDTLSVNPQIGFLNGALLSGATRPRAFEGIVPTLTVTHDDTWTEGQFYMGYYMATRSPRQNDFLHWWINSGVKPFADSDDWLSILSVGAHFEQLRLARTRGGAAQNIYLWLGPYVQFAFPNNLALRFSAGTDLENFVAPNFYKATVNFSF